MASNADKKDEHSTWNGFAQGDIAVRKGRLCTIQRIHWDTHPPTVTVKMHDGDANNEVGTEFSRLQKPTDEDMLKLPLGWYCSACTVENEDMDAQRCYLCDTPRTFEESVKYPCPQPQSAMPPTSNHNTAAACADSVVINNSSNEEQKQQKQSTSSDSSPDNTQLTVITWNVWFNEELRVIERMKAIGETIEAYNADIVCLQEVTPLILDILQSAAWYKQYESTILPNHGFFQGLTYFNVILTKHEFVRDAIQFKPFGNTQMGRHLIVAPIKLKHKGARSGTIVHAATTHLESPVGTYAGGKKDKFSAERKQQLQQALSVLDDRNVCSNNNIVFGGDFNWCKPTKNVQNDGDLNAHLNQNWIDCYSRLHANENGYTYDAKSNGMLLGYLQNRLDRILLKQTGNLCLNQIEIIGREAIPNLRYAKVVRRKKGDETQMLPVLPSDHYGLCATFDIK
eukprot:CAMPEP_0202703884 /NCGR_PEP_ID=MMETSP1385-20130828/16677_1 /ASSEMBLY_ACC=CAM_ASM_000861 /TAXON_ID=933848 /ORGANISM="Elphidium margaritaceum" /LENGTH=453 /DNA_ID=CAMNT_0049361805 /DNA_START=22 /DNA_END=1383 /DNA_ORIENTATION=-